MVGVGLQAVSSLGLSALFILIEFLSGCQVILFAITAPLRSHTSENLEAILVELVSYVGLGSLRGVAKD